MNIAEALALVSVAIMSGTLLLPLFRGLGRRLEGTAPRNAVVVSPESAKRLERMEQAIEAMAVEIERISEGQRFVTRVLAERERDPLRLPAEPR